MKLMKHITIALVLCAIPAVAFGQTADCEGCTHQVPIYMGAGGFIATATGDEVNWRSTCGNVTRTGSEMADDDGVVSMSLGGDLACDDEDGTFELGPVMDGGWFWMHVGENSGIGNLVADAVMDNEMTDITAHDSVTITDGAGVSLVMHTSGRFGLLPNILPVADVEPTPVNTCSYGGAGTAASPYVREDSNCMLGNGGTMIRAQGPTDVFTGKRTDLMPGGSVTRPTTGNLTVTVDLWGNGSGHFVTTYDAADNGANARLGHGPDGVPLDTTISAMLGAVGPNAGVAITTDAAASAGLTFEHDGTSDVGTLTMAQHASYCAPTANPPVNYPAEVTFTAAIDTTQATQVTPRLAVPAAGGNAATFKLTVVCPSPSASQQGVELVPENPFPVN